MANKVIIPIGEIITCRLIFPDGTGGGGLPQFIKFLFRNSHSFGDKSNLISAWLKIFGLDAWGLAASCSLTHNKTFFILS